MKEDSAIELLTRKVQEAVAYEPAVLYEGPLVERVAEELGGFPMLAWEPFYGFQPTYAPRFFLGGTSARNSGETSHLHPDADEGYMPVTGVMNISCRRGDCVKDYRVEAGSFLLVPAGTVHLVASWEEPGFAYVVRSPSKATKVAYDI